jgi:hypothetical protein
LPAFIIVSAVPAANSRIKNFEFSWGGKRLSASSNAGGFFGGRPCHR